MHACQDIVDVILGQHDFADARKLVRFILPHPEDLGSGKAGECDIGGSLAEHIPADLFIQIIDLLLRSSVIPENRRTDHFILIVQHHKAVHLSAGADAGYLRCVLTLQKLRNAFQNRFFPVLRILLGPAGMREKERILFGDHIFDLTLFIHQQQLDSRSPQVYANIQHICSSPETVARSLC